MKEPQVRLTLSGGRCGFAPGETLRGTWSIEHIAPEDLKAVELSVLWHTEGKGDEDLTVHHFQRAVGENSQPIGDGLAQHFSVDLPNSPLSYDGLIVKIRWCVRVRAFLNRGRELLFDLPFKMGQVPAACLPLASQSIVETGNVADTTKAD